MRTLLWLGVIVSILLAPISTVAKTSGPKIVVPEKIHDFGQVIEGKILEYSFKVKNEGDEALTIKSVRPG